MTNKFKFNDDSDNDNSQQEVLDKKLKNLKKNYKPNYAKLQTKNAGLYGTRFTPDYSNYEKNKDNERYDFYGNYLNESGINPDNNNITRYQTTYINIDSSKRKKNITYQTDFNINLNLNSLEINSNSTFMKIYLDKKDLDKFELNDKISMEGFENITKNLKTVTNNINALQFFDNSKYLKINYPPGLYFEDINSAKAFKTDLYIKLRNIQDNFISNIHVNTLNSTHKVLFFNPDNGDFSNDYFFIELTQSYINNNYQFNNYVFQLDFMYIYGIPINLLNAKYPININHINGYHLIEKINTVDLYLLIDLKVYSNLPINSSMMLFGNNSISIAKLLNLDMGYKSPSNYTITLDKTFNNVILIKFISSFFPTLKNLITDCNNSNIISNNIFYWQNLEDGDNIYSINVPAGNYSTENLFKILEKLVSNTLRTSPSLGYSNKNIMTFQLGDNNETIIKSYKVAILSTPFTNINTSNLIPTQFTVTYDVQINHQYHNLNVGDIIIIQNSLDNGLIPDYIMNGEHIITSIIDANNYKITITNFNELNPSSQNYGGNAIKILVPNCFRIRLDLENNIGEILNFKNIGNPESITKYDTVITNMDLYETEYNENFEYYQLINNNINYFIIKSNKELNVISDSSNSGLSKGGFFAKIINNPNKLNQPSQINTFVNTPLYFHNPIPSLNELHFEFYDHNNKLINYANFEHNFTLEITTLLDIPEGTHISTGLSKIN